MFSGLEYVKETIDLRSQDIRGNEFETNNLLMDDILLALGYNKRRNKGVKAIYSDQADWEIEDNGDIRLIIKVIGYGSLSEYTDIDQNIAFLAKSEGQFLIITDGKGLRIYSDDGLVTSIDDIFSNDAEKILDMLSYKNWNPSGILELKLSIDIDDIVNILLDDSTVEFVINRKGLDNSDKLKQQIKSYIKEILDNSIEIKHTPVEGKETKDIDNSDRLAELEKVKSQYSSTLEELNKLKETLSDTENKLTDTENKLTDTENKLTDTENKLTEQISLNKQLSNQSSNINNIDTGRSDDTEAYRKKIEDLLSNIQQLNQELQTANDKIKAMEKEKAGAEDERVVMARQLMEAVEDNPDLNRTYVGVVNSKLFQISDLPRFIGTCLQELYAAVSFKLMPLLFDGDIFKTIQPAVRKDMMINTKTYDIDVTGYTEDELLTKLKVLFSQFPETVFMCKTIGTIKEQPTEIEKQYQSLDKQNIDTLCNEENTFDNSQEFENTDFGANANFDNQDFDENTFDDSEGSEFSTFDLNDDVSQYDKSNVDDTFIDSENLTNSVDNSMNEEPSVFQSDSILALALCDTAEVLWSDSSPIKELKAMANSSRIIKIDGTSWDKMVSDSLSALVTLSNNPLDTLYNIRNTDLSTISNVIKTLEECSEGYVRIFDTNFGIEECQNKQAISTIIGIANEIGIDESSIYMYFEAVYIDDPVLQQNYVPQLEIDATLDNVYYDNVDETIHCLLSGDALSNIDNIQGVSDVEERMFSKVIAVRTVSAMLSPNDRSLLKMTIKSNEDVVKALTTIIEGSPDKGAEQIIQKINEKVKNKTPVINRDSKNVSVDAASMVVGNREYFVDTLPGYKLLQMLICANYEATGDNKIDLRVELNSSLYTAALNGCITSDSYESLGLSLVLKIIEGKTKVINKR